ncbi:lysozyme inhibitor LprI family protein [Rossellomorea vietnamensis]|uniref:lysozyme inhibitor LprI family protein n=1 Tax=Rossellomorea vietnamensis TaxID=218284 RepID=UPI001CC9D1C3|nr:lysozyme inhibitor LprI family protein [Rossellomorea vietnamensis]MCA0149599.1 lysozyme inhibitor LprI family protein [Rossellomorea vietnamensis]
MKKSNWLTVTTFSAMVFVGMSACSQSSDENTASKPESEAAATSTDSDDSHTEETTASDENEKAQSDETSVEESSQEQDRAVTKVEGKQAYIEKLDSIQKELDAMPDKKDSDKGVTNAMKNYYGVSYEKYDDALNEIYSLLKEKLSPEVMAELKSEQVKWIEEKEAKAEKERLKYEGGTFENVAWYISLYESTKARCYELVEEYMTE